MKALYYFAFTALLHGAANANPNHDITMNEAEKAILRERIECNVKIDSNGCWIWQKAKDSDGYGKISSEGRTIRTHRASWMAFHAEIPDGLNVLHKCDVPACVNPEHLFLGTHQDNADDRASKSRAACGDRSGARQHPERMPRGESHGMSKLTDDKVRMIRADLASGMMQRTIAEKFGVMQGTISFIKRGKIWKHVTVA